MKDVAKATAKEKVIVAKSAEARARGAEKDRAQVEQQRVEAKVKLGEAKLRVTGAKRIITARDKEIAELKAALKESENKYYNMGFNDAENSTKPIMFGNQKYGLGEGWLAIVIAMGVLEDSPLRNPDQIPYPEPALPTTQNPTEAEDKDTQSMKELVQAIDSLTELINLRSPTIQVLCRPQLSSNLQILTFHLL